MKNIVLIGMPCCGKTTFAKLLAQITNRNFVDCDEFIEKKYNITITNMCEKFGKDYFRAKETEVIKELSTLENTIISTGGGAVLNKENIKNLKENGIVIFIDRKPNDILKSRNIVENRPFLQDENSLFQMYNERLSLYEKYSSYVVQNDNFDETIEKLIEITEKIYKSRKYFVIGYPIKHSLSPKIHMAIFDDFFDNAIYETVEVSSENIGDWISNVKKNSIDGFNVTMPHKQTIIPFLDKLDDSVLQYGSCNTVVNKNGTLVGYNTDADGFFQCLSDKTIDINGKTIAFLGCGNVAQALIKGAIMRGVKKINIAERNYEKFKQVESYKKEIEINYFQFNEKSLIECSKNADLLINCTPLGMNGIQANYEYFDFLSYLSPSATVVDLIYSPRETQLLKYAKKLQFPTINGLGMLIYQGIIADEHYVGSALDKNYYYNKILEILNVN
ncbi:MAG: shikimate kinase [Oscillospiraceae bacterium]